ncbi:histone acetyltransferase Ecym_4704 [Eremothecium cymbalariae DBVPG|uniref:Histone acetyltransferase n=1 Tax=Eremothecium cymbalariae (strain CBS 270.75 / DBVPG 7215 / KCTC 17166 / NRRL Y-17582) TaxID=931890 RepID=G8JSK2_ERECY|nr:hypothetical protein Ecym_4704 [Eremothecium cymbalariae DBVPG\
MSLMVADSSEKGRKSRLLNGLKIKDIIESDGREEITKRSGGRRSYRVKDGQRIDYRLRKTRGVEKGDVGRGVPGSIEEWNELSPNVGFRDGSRHKVEIRYDPRKVYNFERIIKNSKGDVQYSKQHHDFEIYETEDLLNMLDNESYPYRGAIAHKKDYSTHRTTPNVRDRQFFQKLLFQSASASKINGNTLLSFTDEPASASTRSSQQRVEETTKIEYIYFNDNEIETWYRAPYPEEFNKNRILYICHSCLKYMNSKYVYYRHRLKCTMTHPPGNEIYRDGKISIWEVDGREQVIYCQNLCLLAKLFLNSKTLYYDVEPFVFYVLTENEELEGTLKFNIVGYFSKEKLNTTDYNLSCILVLPTHQRLGYGHLLMDFSYLLSRREFKWGTPEKPLSDLGLLSYRNYWKIKMIKTLSSLRPFMGNSEVFKISLEDISNLTGMAPTDVIFGLEQIGCFYKYNFENRYRYAIKIESWEKFQEANRQWDKKGYLTLDPAKLIWKPLIFGPSCGINAVGTMVETTTGNQRNTSAVGANDGNDLFKNSISVLVNFMHDDILDPRPMEEMSRNKIMEQQLLSDPIDKIILSQDIKLQLAYENPKLPNGNHAEHNGKNNKVQPGVASSELSETPQTVESSDVGEETDDPPFQDIETDSYDDGNLEDAADDDYSRAEEEEEVEDYEVDVEHYEEEVKERIRRRMLPSRKQNRRLRAIRGSVSSHVEFEEDESGEKWVDAMENAAPNRRVLRNRNG